MLKTLNQIRIDNFSKHLPNVQIPKELNGVSQSLFGVFYMFMWLFEEINVSLK